MAQFRPATAAQLSQPNVRPSRESLRVHSERPSKWASQRVGPATLTLLTKALSELLAISGGFGFAAVNHNAVNLAVK